MASRNHISICLLVVSRRVAFVPDLRTQTVFGATLTFWVLNSFLRRCTEEDNANHVVWGRRCAGRPAWRQQSCRVSFQVKTPDLKAFRSPSPSLTIPTKQEPASPKHKRQRQPGDLRRTLRQAFFTHHTPSLFPSSIHPSIPDRQTDGRTDRQTDRHTYSHTHIL